MVRRIVGAVIGIVVAFAVVSLVEMLDVRLFPIAAGVDFDDPRAVEALIAAMPPMALAMVAAGWVLGALAGGVAAIAIARWALVAWVPAIAVLAGSIVNLATIHHPWWMVVAGIVLPIVAAPVAMRLAGRRWVAITTS